MTNPPTDERREAFEKWLRSKWTPGYGCAKRPDGEYVDNKAQFHWNCWQAALSHHGEVVKVSEIRALQAYWCDWNDQSLDEQPDPDEAIVEFANITIVYKYGDLNALISKAEKV